MVQIVDISLTTVSPPFACFPQNDLTRKHQMQTICCSQPAMLPTQKNQNQKGRQKAHQNYRKINSISTSNYMKWKH